MMDLQATIDKAIETLNKQEIHSVSDYIRIYGPNHTSEIISAICHHAVADHKPVAVVTSFKRAYKGHHPDYRAAGIDYEATLDDYYSALGKQFDFILLRPFKKGDRTFVIDGTKPGNICMMLCMMSREPWERPRKAMMYYAYARSKKVHPILALYLMKMVAKDSTDFIAQTFRNNHDFCTSDVDLPRMMQFIHTPLSKFDYEKQESFNQGNRLGTSLILQPINKNNPVHLLAKSYTKDLGDTVEAIGYFGRKVFIPPMDLKYEFLDKAIDVLEQQQGEAIYG